MKGKDYVQIGAFWGGTLVALFLAAVAHAKLTRGTRQKVTQKEHTKRAPLNIKSFLQNARRLLEYQLPPRDVWASVCGGISVGDLPLVCVWLCLVLYYFVDRVRTKWHEVEGFVPLSEAINRLHGAAFSFGTCLRMQLLLLLYPVQRSSLLAWLFGAYHSTVIKYHRWMGWGMMATIFAHGYMYSIVWLAEGVYITKGFQKLTNLAGIIAACIAAVIAFTSTSNFRRWWYQAFWLVHVCCMPLFFIAAIIHSTSIVYHSTPAVLLYLLDRAFRFWQHHTNHTHVSVTGGGLTVNGSILTLRTLWSLEGVHGARAGQTVYVSCPTISLFQSHPFSIADVQAVNETSMLSGQRASSTNVQPHTRSGRGQVAVNMVPPNAHTSSKQQLGDAQLPTSAAAGDGGDGGDEYDEVFGGSMLGDVRNQADVEVVVVTLHMRVMGSWTQKLRAHALEDPGHPLQIQMEGPYDTEVSGAMIDWGPNLHSRMPGDDMGSVWPLPLAPEVLIMVSGGVGITPLLGVLRSLARQHAQHMNQHQAAHHSTSHHGREVEIELGKPHTRRAQQPNGLASQQPGFQGLHTSADRRYDESDGASSSSTSGPETSWIGKGPEVYLVHCCRHLDELQLLDVQILQAVCRKHSRLHLHIAYTGFELEHQKSLNTCPEDPVKGAAVTLPGLPDFPQGSTPRLLYPSLGRRPFLHFVHAVLAFTGAAVGGLAVPAAITALLASAHQHGLSNVLRGILVAVPMGLGTFLFPLVALCFMEDKRRRKHPTLPDSCSGFSLLVECCQWWWGWVRGCHRPVCHSGGGKLNQGARQGASGAKQQILAHGGDVQVLPEYVMALGDSPHNRIVLHRGRPNLPTLLRCIRDRHSNKSSSIKGPQEAGGEGLPQQPHTQHSHYGNTQVLASHASLLTGMHSLVHTRPGSSHIGDTDAGMEGAPLLGAGSARLSKGTNADNGINAAGQSSSSRPGGSELASSKARADEQQLTVWVGGPESLWINAQAACDLLNKEGSGRGLHTVRVAHMY